MNFQGLIIGIVVFLIIGVFHPIVIKTEYYFGKKVWPVFLVVGVVLLGLTLFVSHPIFGPLLGVTGVTCLWSIHEIFEQEERVHKGWFPTNPNKKPSGKQHDVEI